MEEKKKVHVAIINYDSRQLICEFDMDTSSVSETFERVENFAKKGFIHKDIERQLKKTVRRDKNTS